MHTGNKLLLFFLSLPTDGSTPSCPVSKTGSRRKEGVLLKSPLFSPTRRWWRRRQRESAVCEPRSKETRDDGDRHLNERRTVRRRQGRRRRRRRTTARRRVGTVARVKCRYISNFIRQAGGRTGGAGELTGGIYYHRRSLNKTCLLYKSARL